MTTATGGTRTSFRRTVVCERSQAEEKKEGVGRAEKESVVVSQSERAS